MIFVFLCVTSLSMIISRSIHLAANGIISFFFVAEWYSIVYVYHIIFFFLFWPCPQQWEHRVLTTGPPGNSLYHIFCIHSSVEGHSGCFHILAIVNSAAMNVGVHVSFQIRVFSRYMPRSRIAGSYDSFVSVFSKEFFLAVFKFLFIYLFKKFYLVLSSLGLRCSTQDLCWGMRDLSLRRMGSSLWCVGFSLVVACRFSLVVAHRLQGAWAL